MDVRFASLRGLENSLTRTIVVRAYIFGSGMDFSSVLDECDYLAGIVTQKRENIGPLSLLFFW